MKAMVVYDSVFGNTAKIAQAIGSALGDQESVSTRQVAEVTPEQMVGLDLLIVGSPTRAFSATPAITKLLKGIPANGLRGVRVAGFDTRMVIDEKTPAILRFLVKFLGYAAEPISGRLMKKGGDLASVPEGFFVGGTEGPLTEGELERAAAWGARIAATS